MTLLKTFYEKNGFVLTLVMLNIFIFCQPLSTARYDRPDMAEKKC